MPDPHAPAKAAPAPAIITDEVAIDAIAQFRDAKKAGLLTTPGRQSSELIQALAHRFSPEVIADHIGACLRATCTTKGGGVVEDNRTRLAALQLLISYVEGRPIERQQVETVNHTADPDADLAMRLRRSPALRKMIRGILEEAEG